MLPKNNYKIDNSGLWYKTPAEIKKPIVHQKKTTRVANLVIELSINIIFAQIFIEYGSKQNFINFRKARTLPDGWRSKKQSNS